MVGYFPGGLLFHFYPIAVLIQWGMDMHLKNPLRNQLPGLLPAMRPCATGASFDKLILRPLQSCLRIKLVSDAICLEEIIHSSMNKPIKIGLCLSGGGAKGIAHIGVIKALQEAGIYPDMVAGTSAGSVVGALYAAGKTPEEMLEFVRDGSLFKIYKVVLPSDGLTKLTYLREKLEQVIVHDSFEDLKRPLFVAVTNLITGAFEIRSKGPLFDVIVASSSIPLVFSPVEIDGHLFVDGGVLANFPVEPLTHRSDVIIGVNLMPQEPITEKSVQNIIGIATRVFALSVWANTQPQLKRCDVVISPPNLEQYNVFQFNKYKELLEIGYEAALDKIPEILDILAAMRKTKKEKTGKGKKGKGKVKG